MSIAKNQSNIDLVLNQISEDVFCDNEFDMTQYPNELFLLEDTSASVYYISNQTNYNNVKQFLVALKKYENTDSVQAILISSATCNNIENISPSTIYLLSYNGNFTIETISGKKDDDIQYITAQDLKDVDDVELT
mgnify:CR=1 FL=1